MVVHHTIPCVRLCPREGGETAAVANIFKYFKELEWDSNNYRKWETRNHTCLKLKRQQVWTQKIMTKKTWKNQS